MEALLREMNERSNVPFEAMRRREDVIAADQSASAHVHIIGTFLLEDGHLPRILAKLAVAVDVRQRLDAAVDSERIAAPASGAAERSRSRRSSAAADAPRAARIAHVRTAVPAQLPRLDSLLFISQNKTKTPTFHLISIVIIIN